MKRIVEINRADEFTRHQEEEITKEIMNVLVKHQCSVREAQDLLDNASRWVLSSSAVLPVIDFD